MCAGGQLGEAQESSKLSYSRDERKEVMHRHRRQQGLDAERHGCQWGHQAVLGA